MDHLRNLSHRDILDTLMSTLEQGSPSYRTSACATFAMLPDQLQNLWITRSRQYRPPVRVDAELPLHVSTLDIQLRFPEYDPL